MCGGCCASGGGADGSVKRWGSRSPALCADLSCSIASCGSGGWKGIRFGGLAGSITLGGSPGLLGICDVLYLTATCMNDKLISSQFSF